MKRAFLTSLFLAAVVIVARAAPAPAPEPGEVKPPAGPAPTVIVVTGVNKDAMALESRIIANQVVPVVVQRVVNQGGQQVVVNTTEYKTAQVERMARVSLQGATAHDSEGKAVPMDDFLKRIKPGMAVLVSQDGKPVDPAFLKLLSKDALVIVPQTPKAPDVPPDRLPPPPLPPVEKK